MGLIDANELLERMKTIENFSNQKGMFAIVQKMIENTPTVDPIKHGHWITWFEDEDVRQAKCSECGMMFTLGKGREIHYCGNCGAKMDEVEDEIG